MITLAVDCMGGDHGPRVTLAACRQFLDSHSDARLLLVGQPDALAGFAHERASVVPASEVVGMDDPIEVALRRKKDSSMRVAIQQVKDGRSEEHTSELQSPCNLVCRLLLEKKKKNNAQIYQRHTSR